MTPLLALLALAAAPQGTPREQVLAGEPFEALLAETRRLCPASPVRSASPAGLLDAEERFADRLGRRDRRRVTQAIPRLPDNTPRSCANSPGGAACPAGATLLAIQRARLLTRFAHSACDTPSIWR